jgi:large subunit ribosomal protein L11
MSKQKSSGSKKIAGYIKLQVAAGKATPSPPIGPALGQRGVNIMEFCKAFNADTQSMKPGTPIPVVITVYSDKSFTYIRKLPPVSYYLKEAAGIDKGSKETGKKFAGKITEEQLKVIAKEKIGDMNTGDIEAAFRMVKGSAMSMGLEVVG